MKIGQVCGYCNNDSWDCISPDYGDGATFGHYCSRTGSQIRTKVGGYTKEQSYRDAGRDDLADRFKR